jgi:hypothetical protein
MKQVRVGRDGRRWPALSCAWYAVRMVREALIYPAKLLVNDL